MIIKERYNLALGTRPGFKVEKPLEAVCMATILSSKQRIMNTVLLILLPKTLITLYTVAVAASLDFFHLQHFIYICIVRTENYNNSCFNVTPPLTVILYSIS